MTRYGRKPKEEDDNDGDMQDDSTPGRKQPTATAGDGDGKPTTESQTSKAEDNNMEAEGSDGDPKADKTEKCNGDEKEAAAGSAKKGEKKARYWNDELRALDCGVKGDCGYRCLAAIKCLQKGAKETDLNKGIEAKATTMRWELKTYMANYAKNFQKHWRPDPAWTNDSEGGPPATSFKEWLDTTLRATRKICGLSMVAAVNRLRLNIVVVDFDGGEKERRRIWKFTPQTASTDWGVLELRAGHYRVLPRGDGTLPGAADIGEVKPTKDDFYGRPYDQQRRQRQRTNNQRQRRRRRRRSSRRTQQRR